MSSKTGPGWQYGEPEWRLLWALSSSGMPTGLCYSLGTPGMPPAPSQAGRCPALAGSSWGRRATGTAHTGPSPRETGSWPEGPHLLTADPGAVYR